MNRLKEKFANWILKNQTELTELTLKHDRLRVAFWKFFDQYTKFKLVAPQTYVDAEEVLEIDLKFRERMEIENCQPGLLFDVVPRKDYESIRVAYDKQVLMFYELQKTLEAMLHKKTEKDFI
jgi:hypothetical protein